LHYDLPETDWSAVKAAGSKNLPDLSVGSVKLKQNPMTEADLEDFVSCYHPENRQSALESFRELMGQLKR
jgi:hypothetical protein